MELAYITIRFESPEEQKFVEKECGFAWESHETFDTDSGYKSWTEFDISGCEPQDIGYEFNRCQKEFEESQR